MTGTATWELFDYVQLRADKQSVFLTTGPLHIAISGDGLSGAEHERTVKQLEEAQTNVNRLASKLNNADFRARAPADVVAREEEHLGSAQSRLAALEQRLKELE